MNDSSAHVSESLPAGMNRLTYIDLLRIMAAFFVIVGHLAALDWDTAPVTSFDWQVMNIYNGFVRFSVPVFVMCSGVFFLNPKKEITYQKLFGKYILRIVTTFVFWSACYALAYTVLLETGFDLKIFFIQWIRGHYHLWFLYMIAGLYLIVPFVRKITENKTLTRYFLLLGFIFGITVPFMQAWPAFRFTVMVTDSMQLFFVMGYTFYFVVGYYLYTYPVSKTWEIVLYCLGVLGVIATIYISSIVSLGRHRPFGLFDFLSPNCMFVAVAVFVLFTKRISKIRFSRRSVNNITRISKCTFVIYLIHVFGIMLLEAIGITARSFNVVFSIPVIAIAVFGMSFVSAYGLRKIPFLSKYIT